MKSLFAVLLLLVILENKNANGGLIKRERKTTPQAPYISDSPIVDVPMLKIHHLCAKDQGCDRVPGNVVCLGHRGEKYLRVAQSLCHFKAYLRCNRMDAEREPFMWLHNDECREDDQVQYSNQKKDTCPHKEE